MVTLPPSMLYARVVLCCAMICSLNTCVFCIQCVCMCKIMQMVVAMKTDPYRIEFMRKIRQIFVQIIYLHRLHLWLTVLHSYTLSLSVTQFFVLDFSYFIFIHWNEAPIGKLHTQYTYNLLEYISSLINNIHIIPIWIFHLFDYPFRPATVHCSQFSVPSSFQWFPVRMT